MNKIIQSITLDFPKLRQTFNYDCGATAIESVLAYYGIEVREDAIIQRAHTTQSDGTCIGDIIATFHDFHLQTTAKEMTLQDIKNYLDQHIPVLLVLQAWTEQKKVDWKNDWDDGHYVVAIGYDETKIIFDDPSSFERTYLTFDELQTRWHDVDVKNKKYFNYGIAVYGDTPKFSNHAIVHMD